MIFLRTGLPGASKSLNSLRELVLSHDEDRPYFYTNIKLLMLDMEVASSFSGWFYGWYFPRLKDAAQKRKLIKIMKPIHDNDDFVTLDDLPFLRNSFDSHRHVDTWLYWVKRVFPKASLNRLNNILACLSDEQLNSPDVWDSLKVCNLHFTRFDDPNYWYDLPKKSVILIDECQQFFPPRAVGSRKPEAIAKLETHRHGGYDIHFITQHPTLADQNLRKLVGRHIHFHNPFGGKRIARYEAPKCVDFDNYHDKKQATKKFTVHDTSFYGVYWSAEIHTHKFKFPKILLVLVFTVLCVLFGVYYIYSLVSSKADSSSSLSPETSQEISLSTPVNSSPSPSSTDDFVNQYVLEITKDVFINGSITYFVSGETYIDYTFYRATDDAIFYPEDVGLKVQPISKCLANIVIADTVKPISCNPFYVREPVEEDDELTEEFKLSDKSNGFNI